MAIALFVDGYFAYMCYDRKRLDFAGLRNLVESDLEDTVDEAYYFGATPKAEAVQRFYRALSLPPPLGPGFRVKEYWTADTELHWPASLGGKKVTHPETGRPFVRTQQKAVDVGLAYHLGRSFSKRKWDKLVLFAGDADFHEPVQHLVEYDNIDLYLVGTVARISNKLRGYAKRIYCVDDEPLASNLLWSPAQ